MKKIKLPSEELKLIIDRILQKRAYSKQQLAKELDVDPAAISRWLAGSGIYKTHYDKLLEMVQEEPTITPIEKISPIALIPFSVTIPRESLRVTLDKNGDINIKGFLRAILDKETQ